MKVQIDMGELLLSLLLGLLLGTLGGLFGIGFCFAWLGAQGRYCWVPDACVGPLSGFF